MSGASTIWPHRRRPTQTPTTTSPGKRTPSHEMCTHHLTLTPTFLPALSDLPPLMDGHIPLGRVHVVPGGDILRVRGQDFGPRRRRLSPAAQTATPGPPSALSPAAQQQGPEP